MDDELVAPDKLAWRWEHRAPLRWLLVDEYTDGRPETAVAVCSDIDGLFVVPEPPPPVESYTLLGCAPGERLSRHLDGSDGAWLGNLVLDAVHRTDRPLPNTCDPVQVGCVACMEELVDLTLVAVRPSSVEPGLMDIELSGRMSTDRPYTRRTSADPPEAVSYQLTGLDEEVLGTCRAVEGVFRARPEPAVHPVTPLGCRPEAPLRAAMDVLAKGAGNPGGAMRRRRIDATVFCVAEDGDVLGQVSALHGSVADVRPSALGDGLWDVRFDSGLADTLPTASRGVWERRRVGPPAEMGEWIELDRELRHQWVYAALRCRRRRESDRPGHTYHLDGRHITDIEGFYCAIGEAVNGPGGYFGLNADALRDCVIGGWGATRPFRLVWHHSDVARTHLVGYDRRRWAPATTVDDIVRWIQLDGVEIELR